MSEPYKREIEEILKQAGELGPKGKLGRSQGSLLRLVWLHAVRSLGGKAWSITPGRVMLTALVLIISALLVGAFGLGFAGLLGWAGLVLFIIGYAMFFIRPTPVEKRWRGEVIDDSDDSWWGRLRRRIK